MNARCLEKKRIKHEPLYRIIRHTKTKRQLLRAILIIQSITISKICRWYWSIRKTVYERYLNMFSYSPCNIFVKSIFIWWRRKKTFLTLYCRSKHRALGKQRRWNRFSMIYAKTRLGSFYFWSNGKWKSIWC